MMLKSFWTSHLQMMNGLENWTGRQKGIPKGVDETHIKVASSHMVFSLRSDFQKVCYYSLTFKHQVNKGQWFRTYFWGWEEIGRIPSELRPPLSTSGYLKGNPYKYNMFWQFLFDYCRISCKKYGPMDWCLIDIPFLKQNRMTNLLQK